MSNIGRPKSSNSKNNRFEIRMNEADAELLQKFANVFQTSRTDVLMQGLKMLRGKKGVCIMDAKEARRKSEEGAIRVIEDLIAEAAESGRVSIDVSDYAVSDAFGETAREYFADKGYRILGSVISW